MILITGSTGLLGSHLIAHFILNKTHIKCLKRKSSSLNQILYVLPFYNLTPDDLNEYISWINADINDQNSLIIAFNGIKTVYHCAAEVNLGGVDEKAMFNTNINGTQNIINAAKLNNINTLCYVSSIAALGHEPHGKLITERSPINGNSTKNTYATSKIEAELLIQNAANQNLNITIVNPGPILGISYYDSSSAKIIYLAKKGIPFSTNGGTGYVDVRDVCRAMIQLVDKQIFNERFTLVGFNASNHQLLSAFAKAFGRCKPIPIPKWLAFSAASIIEFCTACFGKKTQFNRAFARTALNRSFYDNSKIINTLNFSFTPMEDTVKDIATYMKYNNPKHL